MLECIFSGGQTGADQAAWNAAVAAGMKTGGWMTIDFATEDGPRPEFRERYGARPLDKGKSPGARLRLRAKQNVLDTDGTLCFDAAGSQATANAMLDADEAGKPFLGVRLGRTPRGALTLLKDSVRATDVAAWIAENDIRTLNVAGNRTHKVHDIGPFVARYLAEVFRLIRAEAESEA